MYNQIVGLVIFIVWLIGVLISFNKNEKLLWIRSYLWALCAGAGGAYGLNIFLGQIGD